MESRIEVIRYLARFSDLYPAGIPVELESAGGLYLAFVVDPADLEAVGEVAGRTLLADAAMKGLELPASGFRVVLAANQQELSTKLSGSPRALVLLGEQVPDLDSQEVVQRVRTIPLSLILSSREAKKKFWSDLQQLLPLRTD